MARFVIRTYRNNTDSVVKSTSMDSILIKYFSKENPNKSVLIKGIVMIYHFYDNEITVAVIVTNRVSKTL
ncbi:hypothetical protein RCH20_000854 [Psychrobacter sp. PL15]|nr:hypothetical protein [Psychrobacter sp. PL15]